MSPAVLGLLKREECFWGGGSWKTGVECSVMIYYIHIKLLVRVSLFLRVIEYEAET